VIDESLAAPGLLFELGTLDCRPMLGNHRRLFGREDVALAAHNLRVTRGQPIEATENRPDNDAAGRRHVAIATVLPIRGAKQPR
jgi:hypothetical protein